MKKQRFGDNEKASKFISELSHEFNTDKTTSSDDLHDENKSSDVLSILNTRNSSEIIKDISEDKELSVEPLLKTTKNKTKNQMKPFFIPIVIVFISLVSAIYINGLVDEGYKEYVNSYNAGGCSVYSEGTYVGTISYKGNQDRVEIPLDSEIRGVQVKDIVGCSSKFETRTSAGRLLESKVANDRLVVYTKGSAADRLSVTFFQKESNRKMTKEEYISSMISGIIDKLKSL